MGDAPAYWGKRFGRFAQLLANRNKCNTNLLIMQIFTEIYNLRLSKTQKETLDKLADRNIKVSDFIRTAIAEKLERDAKDLVVKPKNVVPF